MPIVWNAEAEARLLAGLFKVCEIKVGKAQLEELAALIDPGKSRRILSPELTRQESRTNRDSRLLRQSCQPPYPEVQEHGWQVERREEGR